MMNPSTSQPLTIFLWIVPRTRSTALAKCMSWVDDVQVWMEPYNACCFNETFYNPEFKPGDPVIEEMRATLAKNEASETMKELRSGLKKKIQDSQNIIDQQNMSFSWVKEQLENPDADKKFIFVKDQACAINNHLDFLPNISSRHTFLIRHPKEVYPSHKDLTRRRFDFEGMKSWEECHAANDSPFLPVKDFFRIQHSLWKYFKENSVVEPIIIDSHDLFSHPEDILPKYFKKLGIPYKESYLQWDASDTIIEEKWKGSADFVLLETKTIVFQKAAKSSRFNPPKFPRGTTSNPDWTITPELEEFVEGALPFYEEMYNCRLR